MGLNMIFYTQILYFAHIYLPTTLPFPCTPSAGPLSPLRSNV